MNDFICELGFDMRPAKNCATIPLNTRIPAAWAPLIEKAARSRCTQRSELVRQGIVRILREEGMDPSAAMENAAGD